MKAKKTVKHSFRTTADIEVGLEKAAKRENISKSSLIELGASIVSKLSDEGKLKEFLIDLTVN